MKLEDYTYNLPENLIAAHPPKVRGASRLLALNRKTGEISDSFYRNVADFFESGDVLILNDTKVIKARIFTQKERKGTMQTKDSEEVVARFGAKLI